MSALLQIAIGGFITSSAIAYAFWIPARVWMLRQDLFAIRDCMWDRMHEKGRIDDPAHRALRERLNGLIRLASVISWVLLADLWLRMPLPQQERENEWRADIPAPVEEARSAMARVIVNHLMRRTLLGWGFSLVFWSLELLVPFTQKVAGIIDTLLRSDEVGTMSRQYA